MSRSNLLTILKLVIAVGLLIFLFTRLEDPAALWAQIVHSNKLLLLLGAFTYASAVALSGLKWGVLLRAADVEVTTPRLLSYQWVAEFFNNFLPAQVGGDLIRGYAVAVDTHRTATAAASVVIDRFLGLTVFMLAAAFASTAMLLFGKPDGQPFSPEGLFFMRFAALGSVAFTLALLGATAALLSRRLKRLLERVLARLPLSQRTLPLWNRLGAAFDVYRDRPRALLLTALGSVAIVVLTSVNIWLISWAIEPGSITFIEVLAINPIIVFAMLVVPLTPGGLGVRQVSFAALFYFTGAGYALGTAVGLVQQFIGYLVSVPGGLLWVRGYRRKPAAPQPAEQPPLP